MGYNMLLHRLARDAQGYTQGSARVALRGYVQGPRESAQGYVHFGPEAG